MDGCRGHKLKVIEFNAERGKRWLESAELLRDADVIILNEMDIGMARSDQQHTTRLMAYFLGMNYAWGLEFVELTLGDQGDRNNIDSSEQNFHGLHGNAILSKCKITNTTIFRNQVGSYFSHKPNTINAKGLEKRLGGRMIMLGRIMVNGTSVVIGSTHKLKGLREEVKEYIHTSPTVIAGDQAQSFCGDVGLNVIQSDPKHHTWPASCTSLGGHRGDNICSNLKVAEDEYTLFPCVRQYGLNISLGDHALTGALFKLP
uniref:Endonuclease/exonuclease/phosphatase domain-containing protein n=1 Tax=Skeletonema marinoi TaxID=267567 RepID=A0A7S2M1N7_9STRA